MNNLINDELVIVTKGDIKYLQFKILLQYDKYLRHAFSMGLNVNFRTKKKDHELIKEELALVIDNYQKFSSLLGSNYLHIIKPNQAHTDNVVEVSKKINRSGPDINLKEYDNVDGLITKEKNLMLATINADCILILFFDPVLKVIANVHSGWRGTLQLISVKTVDKMVRNYGSKRSDIICCIGPSIRKCHFEVTKEVKDLFASKFYKIKDEIIFETVPFKKWVIDSVLLNKIMLEEAGLAKDNIVDCGICTVCNNDIFHSYRIEKDNYKAETALIELK